MDCLNPDARAMLDALSDAQRAALAAVLKGIAHDLSALAECLTHDEPWPEEPPMTNPQAPVLHPEKPRRHEPWRSQLTPNQTMIALRLLVGEQPTVSIAAQARCTKAAVTTVASEYARQIDAMRNDPPEKREATLTSLHRQMLHRWQAAGHSIDHQPEVPIGESRLSRLAK